MRKSLILIACLLLAQFVGRGQVNMVLNPQFEIYDTCPHSIDAVTYCRHWTSLDSAWRAPDWAHDKDGVPEYCNGCSAYIGSSVPNNALFNHNARSGNAMMQLIMFAPNLSVSYQRDYLQGHLTQNLLLGHKYDVKFYALQELMSGDAVNGIGAYFDDGIIDTARDPSCVQVHIHPQIINTSVVSDTLLWTKIEDTFTAIGTERLVTIGQFLDSAHTTHHHVTSSMSIGDNWSWYLIDDVSVIDCDNIPYAGRDTVIHPGDSAFIGSHEPLLPYKWFKLSSSTIIDSSTGGIWVRPVTSTQYVVEQELCGVKRWDTVKVWVWPDTPSLIRNYELGIKNVKVYPNPATKELTIEGAKGCDVVVCDLVGREVASFACKTNKHAIDVSALPNGTYVAQIIDHVTSAKTVRLVLKE